MEIENPFQAAQTIDSEVRAYIYSLVTALGGAGSDEQGQYVLGDDALACLRDLKRWLKLYDEKTDRLDVARCLAEAKLVNGDLLPILTSSSNGTPNDKLKSRIALACLELLVPLTWPLDHQTTENHYRHTPYLEQAQVLYKASILGHDTASILRIAVRVGLPAIAMPRRERSPRDEGIIKLMLYFLRNISIISQNPGLPSQGLENEISRSATIEAFKFQDVFALLLTLCSNMGDDFDLQDVIILEILFHLVRGVDVEKLFMNETQRKIVKTGELRDVLKQEKGMHRDYKKTAPTRHGRFGTMIWVKRDEEKYSTVSGQDTLKDGHHTLAKMDESKKWKKPRQRRKHEEHSIQDFDRDVTLTGSATDALRVFVEEFLDSGFNPLFVHLRKAVEREAERLLPVNYRQYFYTVSWFLHAERARRARHRQDHQRDKLRTDFEADSYGLVAGVLNQEMFITLNRSLQIAMDHKEWQDLNACMRCFTQILLMVQDMAQSPIDDDKEIADNIQSRIFYEETTHDRIVSILRDFKDQGFGYLNSCTHLAHVFLRMLERYSKENVDLQIRSRRQARRRKRAAARENGEGDNDDPSVDKSEDEDIIDAAQISRERKFDFNRFSAKFTTQKSVDTFVAFVKYYRELSIEQLKRCHRFFYRVAFKQELAVLLFRVDVVQLFYKMIKGPAGLDTNHELFKDWEEFARQLIKRLFKKLNERPELIVELLFSKIPSTLFFLEFGHEKPSAQSSRNPIELEISARTKTLADKISIVIGALQAEDNLDPVHMVLRNLQVAFDERKSWEVKSQARKEIQTLKSAGPSSADRPLEESGDVPTLPPSISVKARSPADTLSITKNAKTRLLMSLVGFVQTDPYTPQTWHVPPSLTSAAIQETLQIIEQNLQSPVSTFDGEEPLDLLRRTKKSRMQLEGGDEVAEADALRAAFISDSEGSDLDAEDFQFPDNLNPKSPNSRKEKPQKKKTLKRKRDADPDEELLAEKRKAREENALARRRKIKSDLYIRESDDETDEEADKEFFEMEEKRRREQEDRVVGAMLLGKGENKGKKKKKKNKRNDGTDAGGTDAEISDMDDLGIGLGIGLDDNDDNLERIALSPTPSPTLAPITDSDADSDKENVPSPHRRQIKRRKLQTKPANKPNPSSSILPSNLNSSSPTRSSPPDSAADEETDTPISSPVPASPEKADVDMEAGVDRTEPVKGSREDVSSSGAPRRRVRAGFIVDSDEDE